MEKIILMMKKIFRKITNFLKLLFVGLCGFILSFFPSEKRKGATGKKETKKENSEVKFSTINNDSNNFFSTKILEKKENSIEKKDKTGSLMFPDKLIIEEIKKVLQEKEKKLEDKIITKEILPEIKTEIQRKNINNLKEAKKETKKSVEKHLLKNEKNIVTEIKKIENLENKRVYQEHSEVEGEKNIDLSLPQKNEDKRQKVNNLENENDYNEKDNEINLQKGLENDISPAKVDNREVIETNKENLKEETLLSPEVISEKEIKVSFPEKAEHLKNEAEEKKDSFKKQEESKSQEKITVILNDLINETNKTIAITNFGTTQEEKNYELNIKELDELLNKIENIKTKYGPTLSEEQKNILRQEEIKVLIAKNSLEKQQDDFIEKETQILEEVILRETKEKLQKEIEKLHIANQLEINEILLNDIEKLNSKTSEEIAMIEKYLIKSKLKKASKTLEVPFLLSLPFIRNKYFLYFTAALFVNNHFNFLHCIFRRKTKKYEEVDLAGLKKGQDALIGALGMTLNNIEFLERLESEAIERYPELLYDEEFITIINDIKGKLYDNYNALAKKQEMINRYSFQHKKQMKRMRKKVS